MDSEEIENEINEEKSNKNNFNKVNDINSDDNININFSSNKEINKEDEEKSLLEEIDKLENEKQKWFQKRKEQSDILENYMNVLKSLQIKSRIELKNIEIEDTNFELGELVKYNSMLNEIESQERLLEEEKMYFEKYKNDFNQIYEDKQKEIEDMRLNYQKEKDEIDKKIEILETEEKMIDDKYNAFEFEKKILTDRYNNAINKEADLLKSKMKLENSIAELDRRNLIFEKNKQLINEAKYDLMYQISKNSNEEKRIIEEKNNIKARQDMVDSLRIKYVGDITNSPFELMSKTFNDKSQRNQQNYMNNKIKDNTYNFSTINQNNFYKYSFDENKYNNDYNNSNNIDEEYMKNINYNNNINQNKLSIIEEDKKNSENSISMQENK